MPNVLGDAIAAFHYNSRLSDMYAWSVINFFDYQYSFGIDTIFRLVDVVMGAGIIYGMSYLILGRKPRLKIEDAKWTLLSFVLIFLTQHGRTLYAGFSVAHNYLIITLTTVIFAIPYVKLALGKPSYDGILKCLGMAIMGFVFGFSSNITPIAFVMTYIIYKIFVSVKHSLSIKAWEIFGLLGVLAAIALAYIFGPGVSSYANGSYAQTYDYITISQLLSTPLDGIIKITKHVIANFGRVFLPPTAACLIPFVIVVCLRLKKKSAASLLPKDNTSQIILTLTLLFAVIHIAISSQIRFPLRIALPAYIACTVAALVLIKYWLSIINKRWLDNLVLAATIIAAAGLLVTRASLAIQYRQQTNQIFEKIRHTESNELCIPRSDVHSKTVRMIYLGQEDMLAEWAMPEYIYGRKITFCE